MQCINREITERESFMHFWKILEKNQGKTFQVALYICYYFVSDHYSNQYQIVTNSINQSEILKQIWRCFKYFKAKNLKRNGKAKININLKKTVIKSTSYKNLAASKSMFAWLVCLVAISLIKIQIIDPA